MKNKTALHDKVQAIAKEREQEVLADFAKRRDGVEDAVRSLMFHTINTNRVLQDKKAISAVEILKRAQVII